MVAATFVSFRAVSVASTFSISVKPIPCSQAVRLCAGTGVTAAEHHGAMSTADADGAVDADGTVVAGAAGVLVVTGVVAVAAGVGDEGLAVGAGELQAARAAPDSARAAMAMALVIRDLLMLHPSVRLTSNELIMVLVGRLRPARIRGVCDRIAGHPPESVRARRAAPLHPGLAVGHLAEDVDVAVVAGG